MNVVDQLVRAARRAEPPPAELSRMVDRALRTPPEAARPRTARWPIAAALGASMIAAWIVWLARPVRVAAVTPPPIGVERLHLSGGHLELVATHPVEVTTPSAVVAAASGAFTIDDGDGVSHVTVTTGSVTVTEHGATHAVFAGSTWASAARPAVTTYAPQPAPAVPVPRQVARHRYDVPAEQTSAWSDDVKPDPLVTARGQLRSGKYADALVTLGQIQPTSAAAYQLIGDAERALGHDAAAANAYDRVGDVESAYTAAYLRHHHLHDDAGALASLGGADDEGSPLEERALALRVQILVGLKRDATPQADRYLARFPDGDLRDYMQTVRASR